MLPSIYTSAYDIPAEYQSAQTKHDASKYPNLNSIEYRSTQIDHSKTMHPIWECIDMSKKGEFLIGTNKAHGREWNSTFWGFENLKAVKKQSSKYCLQNNSHVKRIVFCEDHLLLGAFRNGGVKLWSAYNTKNMPDQLLLPLGSKFEHERPIECLELMGQGANLAITGGQDYKLKIWDFGRSELRSVNTYRYAHIDTIYSIAAMQNEKTVFATASSDKSVLLWDIRETLPAIALYENHNVGFKHIVWADQKGISDTYLYAGDEAGFVHCIDKRQSHKFVNSIKLADRPIHKLAINGNNLAVIANTNIVTIYSLSKNTETTKDNHKHLVRDCIWQNPTTLITVGCDSRFVIHKIA